IRGIVVHFPHFRRQANFGFAATAKPEGIGQSGVGLVDLLITYHGANSIPGGNQIIGVAISTGGIVQFFVFVERQLGIPGAVVANILNAHIVIVSKSYIVGNTKPGVVGGIGQEAKGHSADSRLELALVVKLVADPAVVKGVHIGVK